VTDKKRFSAILTGVILSGITLAWYTVHIPSRLEFLGILSIIAFYPVFTAPRWGLYIIFSVSPFIGFIRRLFYLAYERPHIDPLIVMTDIILFFILFSLIFSLRTTAFKNVQKYVYLIAGYIAYLLLRVVLLNTGSIAESLGHFKFYGIAVLFFYIGIIYAKQIDLLKRLWIITAVTSCIVAVYGFSQLFFGYSRAEQLWFSSTYFSTLFIKGVARPFSTFQSPAAFADYSIIGTLALLLLGAWYKKPGKFFIYIPLPIFAVSILTTSVRSNWIGLAILYFLWLILLKIRTHTKRLGFIILLITLFISVEYMTDFLGKNQELQLDLHSLSKLTKNIEHFDLLITNRLSALTNPFKEHSFRSRVSLWRSLFAMTSNIELALFGRGLGTLKADSLYVTYLAEFGFPGLIFIAGIFILFIGKGLRLIDLTKTSTEFNLIRGITALNIVLAIMSITGTHIHSFPGDAFFWFWNGVLIQREHLHNIHNQK